MVLTPREPLIDSLVGDSAIELYINEGLIRPAKVAVIARGHLTLFVFGLVLCFGCPRL